MRCNNQSPCPGQNGQQPPRNTILRPLAVLSKGKSISNVDSSCGLILFAILYLQWHTCILKWKKKEANMHCDPITYFNKVAAMLKLNLTFPFTDKLNWNNLSNLCDKYRYLPRCFVWTVWIGPWNLFLIRVSCSLILKFSL